MSDSDQDLTAQTDEGFISRWSRRKHADNESGDEELDVSEAQVEEVKEEVYLPDDNDMPPIESLDEDSDYSGFMSPKVSEGLRTLALRKLFRSEVFGIRDGLDDYDDDFTNFTKLGNIVTAEMRYQMERLKDAMDSDDEQGELNDETGIEELEAEPESLEAEPENLELADDVDTTPVHQIDEVVEDKEIDETK